MGYSKRPLSKNILLDVQDPSFLRSGSTDASYLAAVAWVEARAMPHVAEWHSLHEWLKVTFDAHLDRLMYADKNNLFNTAETVYNTLCRIYCRLDSVIIEDISYREISDGSLLVTIKYIGEQI